MKGLKNLPICMPADRDGVITRKYRCGVFILEGYFRLLSLVGIFDYLMNLVWKMGWL